MASLILAGGVLAYEKVQASRAKRAEEKAHKAAWFSELEAENAARLKRLQEKTCFCDSSDWDARRGGGCPLHGGGVGGSGREEEGRRDVGDNLMRRESEVEREGAGPMRTDTFATTGETENEILDGYARGDYGRDRDGDADSERPLVVPDVRGVMPVYRDEMGGREMDKGCGKRTLKERVLRRKKRDCAQGMGTGMGTGMEGRIGR